MDERWLTGAQVVNDYNLQLYELMEHGLQDYPPYKGRQLRL